jgi:membrane-associated protease RseP (regulator of RpoE activity)
MNPSPYPADPPVSSAPPPRHREPPRRRLPALLFILTMLTTFCAGTVGWEPVVLGLDADVSTALTAHWQRGLTYAAAVMAVLTAHEAGHFIAARIHGIPATLPFFLPVPVLLTGTLGAVIGMEGSRADRKQLFDIALAGPLAGLVVALPLLALGILAGTGAEANPFALPPLAGWMLAALRPTLPEGHTIAPNALFMAGWVGLLVTGLNMIPISQLDGGHIAAAVFGRRSAWLARGILLSAITGIVLFGRYNWIVMVVMVTLIGADHPPIRDADRPLGMARTILGILSFVIPLVTFMPEPLTLDGLD